MMPWVGVIDPEAYAASRERSRQRREAQRRERDRRRKRLLGVGTAAAVAFVLGAVLGAGGGDDPADKASAAADVPELPGGGTTIFPGRRVVAFYGTSGTAALGTLGRGRPARAAKRLMAQAKAYERKGGPKVLPAFEYIATVASSSPGDDGKYRSSRPLSEVRRYLRAARKIDALLVIDVQPGQADFFAEVKRYARLLRQPDVSLALDPEWKMQPGQIPGQVIGHTDAATVNRISAWLAQIVKADRLPQKLLLVHQFTEGMIRDPARVLKRPGLALTFNVDGYGDRPNKRAKYRDLVPRAKGVYPGFKLFYKQDTGLLRARDVLRLRPEPLYIDYQ